MRPYHVASLLLAPALFTASAVASSPKTDVGSSAPGHISTGISAPVILDTRSFHFSGDALAESGFTDAKVVLSLKVDDKGNAQDVRIVKSAGPSLDSKVVAAVLQSRFRPATLNNHAIPVDMALTVNVQR